MKEVKQQIKNILDMFNAKGFTLLELLVVVLIIGILASIALPQYKKAVAKAELTKLIHTVHALASSQERYYMANSEYYGGADAHIFRNEIKTDLDIDTTTPVGEGNHCEIRSWWVFCKNKNSIYLIFLQNQINNPGQIWCGNKTDKTIYDNICKDMFPDAQDITTKMNSHFTVNKGWRVK